MARLLGERLAQRFGQAFNIDNRPGAGATLGATALARSAPDGYTLMLGSIVDHAIAPHVHKALPFEMQRDLLPVAKPGFGTGELIVKADVPAKTLKDLIALAKAKPGELSYASSGIGGLQHLNAEMFKRDDVVDKLASLGIMITGGRSAQAQARMASEIEKWPGVIRKGNLQLG